MVAPADAGSSAAGSPPKDDASARRRLGWVGLGVAAASFFSGLVAASILGATYGAARGLDRAGAGRDLGFAVATSAGLWIGFLVLPVLWARAARQSGGDGARAARQSGGDGPREARWGRGGVLGLAVRWVDLPLGLVVGLASTGVTALVSTALLTRDDQEALEAKAEEVIDRAQGPAAVMLLVVVLCVITPLAEEVFFRGLLFRSLHRVAGLVAFPIAALVFGLVHYDGVPVSGIVLLVQIGMLSLFGAALCVLVQRTGRLGASIVAHGVFNTVTVVSLLAQR